PDGEVAQPPLVADPPYRAAAQPLVEFLLAPRKELDEARVVEPVPDREVRLGARLRELVPRADELAVVAAVDPVPHQRAQVLRDRALVLDGEVRDAASRVELIGTDDGAGRADVHAFRARAAVLALSFVDRQRQVGVDL